MPTCVVTPTKWATNSSWELPAEKPSNATDALFVEKSATLAAIKIESAVSMRSIEAALTCKGTITCGGSLICKLGNSATVNPNNVCIKLAKGMALTVAEGHQWELVNNITTAVQTITCEEKTLPTLKFSGKGKWELLDKLFCVGLSLSEGNIITGGQEISVNSVTLSAAGASTVKLGASLVTVNGEWTLAPANLTFSCETSTIKLTKATAEFQGGGATYNIVTLEAAEQILKDSSTYATLNINNKGDATGIKLDEGKTQTVTALATNGTQANPAKIISSKAGTQAKIKLPTAQTVSFLKCKDIKVETGSLKVKIPAGTKEAYDLGGNEGITFEEILGGNIAMML